MKVCIYGAGAIGGYIGTRLAHACQADVGVVARGATLAALRAHGWRLRQGGELLQCAARAVEHPAELGVQDVVVVAVKGPALQAVAQQIGPLLGDHTIVLPAMNGVPWWFGLGAAALGEAPLDSVDPGGRIAQAIALHHVVGCVVHISSAVEEPGVVAHHFGNSLAIGEPGGGESPRVLELAALLSHAGIDVTVSPDIRQPIWFKLWGNLTMNPVSAITGATLDRLLDDPLVRAFCSAAMSEASEVGERIGCAVAQSPDDRHAITRRLGAFKSSMLQDLEAGRPLEIDSIVAVTREMAQRVGVPTPNIDALLGLTRLFARSRGLYPPAPELPR